MCDAQADVPSAKRLRAQLAFKNSMVHGILQFTPSIAFCYVLHRCVSRDIRCRESFVIIKKPHPMQNPANGRAWYGPFLSLIFLDTCRVGGCYYANVISLGPNGPTKDAHRQGIQRIKQELNTKDTGLL